MFRGAVFYSQFFCVLNISSSEYSFNIVKNKSFKTIYHTDFSQYYLLNNSCYSSGECDQRVNLTCLLNIPMISKSRFFSASPFHKSFRL